MNLWIVGYGIPSKINPVYGIFSYNQARALASLYDDINVVYIAVDIRSIRRKRKWGINFYKMEKVNIVDCSIPIGNIPNRIRIKVYTRLIQIVFSKARDKYGLPDVIHAHFTDIAYAVLENIGMVNSPKIVVTEHGSSINKEIIDPYWFNLGRSVYKKADALVAVSPSFKEKMHREFDVDPIYIPNAIDSETFYYEFNNSRQDNSFVFVSVGRLEPVKNFTLLIDSFSMAFADENDIKKSILLIIGEGSEHKKLQEKIDSLKMNDRIFLLGSMKNEEVARQYRKSDCFVFGSNSETFGVVCAEALMCGLPVISTKCGGPETIINESNGILVSVNDSNGMASAMKKIKQNYNDYNRRQISYEASLLYSSNVVMDNIRRVYQDLL